MIKIALILFLNRRFIGIEIDKSYYNASENRLQNHKALRKKQNNILSFNEKTKYSDLCSMI